MLQLHFYSNHAGRLVLNNEYHDWWSFDTYPIESIKEFEQVSEAWKTFLADLLRRGLKCAHNENYNERKKEKKKHSQDVKIYSHRIFSTMHFYLQKKMIR